LGSHSFGADSYSGDRNQGGDRFSSGRKGAEKPRVGVDSDAFDNCITLRYDASVRKKLMAVRLKPEQVQKLDKIALREDVPVSWLIRRAIDEFLKHKK